MRTILLTFQLDIAANTTLLMTIQEMLQILALLTIKAVYYKHYEMPVTQSSVTGISTRHRFLRY